MSPLFNYRSSRAKKARFARALSRPWMEVLLIFLAVGFTVGGILLPVINVASGWLLLIPATPCIMLFIWLRTELQELPPQKDDNSLTSRLDGRILGQLPETLNLEQLVKASFSAPGSSFFQYRFGVGADLLANAVTLQGRDNVDRLAVVCQYAEQLRAEQGVALISAPIIQAALLATTPQVESLLAPYHLDSQDVLAGVAWYHHLKLMRAELKRPRNDGGLGRDWSFGYTPLLSRFTQNISDDVLRHSILIRDIATHQQITDHMISLFSHAGRQNAILIGPLGSGKTTIVHALAKRLLDGDGRLPRQLRYQQIFALDPSLLISRAAGRGELEGLVQRLFAEAYAAKNVILFLDDAHLFFSDETGAVNLTNILLPILEAGGLRLILAMGEQEWLRISQLNPALAQYANRVPVAATNRDETMLIMQDQLLFMEFRQKLNYSYQSLQEVYRLSDRYIQDQAMPGKALNLLESAAHFANGQAVTPESVRQAIEKTIGVKVGTADNASERQTLLNMEELIHKRMINQTRAVQVVSDALRRARAGVRNPDRPIGSFLFLGPTGVGKTELSKALAAVFFGGEEHLVRLDLNEYSQSDDVKRLIADAAENAHSLTAQIAHQPYSVVLLDEIEKAHPNVLNTLLQLLDEGILRDVHNRPVSFRDAIIIATSNAGADRIRQYIEAGWKMQDFESRFTDELINSNQFRPEFLNRFDEIVLFRPLDQTELLQVVDLILVEINKTLALQKVSVAVADDAKKLLVQAGYDPRMGARPMRRIVQRAVENIVAKQMLGGEVMPGQQIQISLSDVTTALESRQT